jgi:hypothetical protein
VLEIDEMMKVAEELLELTEVGQKNVRLLGLALSNLDCEREEPEFVQLTLDLK